MVSDKDIRDMITSGAYDIDASEPGARQGRSDIGYVNKTPWELIRYERDKAEMAREKLRENLDAKELYAYFYSQIGKAHEGYSVVADYLAGRRRGVNFDLKTDVKTMQKHFESWFTDNNAAYVLEKMEGDTGLDYALVATPNTPILPNEYLELAHRFCADRNRKLMVASMHLDKFGANDLSGYDENDGKFKFHLVPNRFEEAIPIGGIPKQQAKLAELQSEKPYLTVHSPLTSLTHWFTLRARGYEFDGDGQVEETYSRHIENMIERTVGEEPRVEQYTLSSYAGLYCNAEIIDSFPERESPVRVSVG